MIDVIWNQREVKRLAEFYSTEFLSNNPNHHENVASLQTAFPDAQLGIKQIVTEQDTVAVRWVLLGTHKGEFMNFHPTNNRVRIPGMSFIQISDGKISEIVNQIDLLNLMQQLGYRFSGPDRTRVSI